MNRICLLVTLALAFAASADDAKPKPLRFAKADLGKLPAGWTAARTGKGDGSVWKVVEDKTTPSKAGYALAQTAAGPSALFNLCVLDDSSEKDVELTVSLKAIEGEKDRGGGVVWRYRDADNYYVARFNPLEDNFRLYKVVAGKRIELQSKEELPSKPGTWHVLKVRHVGEQITCHLDGKKLLDVKDDTFAKAGKVGLWSKADAQSHFDDFRVAAAK